MSRPVNWALTFVRVTESWRQFPSLQAAGSTMPAPSGAPFANKTLTRRTCCEAGQSNADWELS